MGLFGPSKKPSRCGGCGRGVPSGARFCPRCARSGGVRPSGEGSSRGPKTPPKVSVCGQRLRNGATCHRSVSAGESCDNPGH